MLQKFNSYIQNLVFYFKTLIKVFLKTSINLGFLLKKKWAKYGPKLKKHLISFICYIKKTLKFMVIKFKNSTRKIKLVYILFLSVVLIICVYLIGLICGIDLYTLSIAYVKYNYYSYTTPKLYNEIQGLYAHIKDLNISLNFYRNSHRAMADYVNANPELVENLINKDASTKFLALPQEFKSQYNGLKRIINEYLNEADMLTQKVELYTQHKEALNHYFEILKAFDII